jgi:hypothetical protein
MLQRLLLIGALTVLGLGVAFAGYIATQPGQPPHPVWVRIVRIGLDETRWRHNIVVDFATADGLTGQTVIPSTLFSCRVGDTVQGVKQGVSISLKPAVCTQARGWTQ